MEKLSADSAQWEEVKETFPGEVIVSQYDYRPDEYLQKYAARRQIVLPEGFRMRYWDYRIKRLDASIILIDGSRVDAIRYGGYDLAKWNPRQGRMVPLNSFHRKEQQISSANKQVFGLDSLDPVSQLIGRKAMWDFFLSKNIGGPNPASNVLLPVATLPADYTFTGTPIEIQQKVREEDSEATSLSVDGATEGIQPINEQEAIDKIVTFWLPGKTKDSLVSQIATLPTGTNLASIITEIATGQLVERLVAEGQIVVQPETGVISLPT